MKQNASFYDVKSFDADGNAITKKFEVTWMDDDCNEFEKGIGLLVNAKAFAKNLKKDGFDCISITRIDTGDYVKDPHFAWTTRYDSEGRKIG